MDIIVTTPKKEIKNSRREAAKVAEEGGCWFRAFNNRPKIYGGDKIYFVEDGYIRGYGIVFEVKEGEKEQCTTTGRIWKGKWIVYYNNWTWLENPIPMKGFQGYRYAEKYEVVKP